MNLAAAASALHLSPSIRQSRLTPAAAVRGQARIAPRMSSASEKDKDSF